ncbi:hypothetical protein H0H81_009774 [Sphagnurus paluster]|uniref:Dienelactone hydrolase domain-containing protein n=1 Tax=Sphagnurus paluster TaxID=117069 RepID=A0A9P7GI95_9AGAR|nr:hypothetical protein H0H81_009774 [Sphagnurus paluster]
MSVCKGCISGVRHEGAPEGKWEEIGGVRCYVATPRVDYPKDKAVLFLTDIFGVDLPNARNTLSRVQWVDWLQTIIPDYLNGDPIPADALLQPGAPGSFDTEGCFAKHSLAVTRPPLDKVIAALKEEGVTTFAATGYCLGGTPSPCADSFARRGLIVPASRLLARYVFDLAFEGIIKAAAASHPSLLQIPADLEKYASTAKAPLLINSCTFDPVFPLEAQATADEILAGGRFVPGYAREHWEGCSHGFAVRGDLSDPKVKAGKEGAFRATVEWFLKYL